MRNQVIQFELKECPPLNGYMTYQVIEQRIVNGQWVAKCQVVSGPFAGQLFQLTAPAVAEKTA